MRATIKNGTITFHREKFDPKFHGIKLAKGEHSLFRLIAKWLNERGFDVIKKRASKDGHMIGDEYQPYIRTRKHTSNAPHIMIWSGFYALRGANEDWNQGEVTLRLETDCFETGQDTMSMLRTISKCHPVITVV